MIDVFYEINVVCCYFGSWMFEVGEVCVVMIMCIYDLLFEDVWDVCTNVEWILCWFLFVLGDLKFGGCY